MALQQQPPPIRPPNPQERGILENWLEISKQSINELEKSGSPYAEYLDDFCGLMSDVLDPQVAG
jgi:hypothetical protein